MNSLRKPLPASAAALSFAEPKQAKKPNAKAATAVNPNRVFFAPEGYRRLTMNVTHEMHKKLKLMAVEQDTTVTEILTKLVEKELG